MKKPVILVVDDNQWFLEYIEMVLGRANFLVESATNGFTAIDKLDILKVNAVFLDIFLPGPNGIALLHEIRSHEDFAHLPIVLLSSTIDEPLENMISYGVVAQLDKATITPQTLVKTAQKAVQYAH